MVTNNNKVMEVELRALVDDIDAVKTNIENAGGVYVSVSSLYDVYFCDKSVNKIEKLEMHDIGSYCLRLRKFTNSEGTKINLNTKSITKTDDHHAWEEHETEVADFVETAKILTATEFKPCFDLEKTRTEYKLGNMNIFIDDIVDFGALIEVEILTTPGLEESAKTDILNFLPKVGVDINSVVPKSVTNMVMKERAFKTKIIFKS